jgi:hypothetical protein
MLPSQRSKSPSTQTGELDKSVINKLFATMKVAYPSFSGGQTDEDLILNKRMWHSHLSEYSAEVIERCARTMVDEFPNRAPTVGQFKKLLSTTRRTDAVERHTGPTICNVCRSYEFTQYHQDICVTGVKRLQRVTDEQIAETKKMFSKLR